MSELNRLIESYTKFRDETNVMYKSTKDSARRKALRSKLHLLNCFLDDLKIASGKLETTE